MNPKLNKVLKIWIKLLIVGVIIFIAGAFIIAVYGLAGWASGIVVSTIGGIIFVVGILIGLTRGFNRAMRE